MKKCYYKEKFQKKQTKYKIIEKFFTYIDKGGVQIKCRQQINQNT